MSALETGTMIEGIGDELVHGFGLFVVAAVPFLIAYRNRQNEARIHPESLENVQHTRQRLGLSDEVNGSHSATINGQATEENEGVRRRTNPQRYNADATCPVCLQEKEYAVETNCGHVFCGNCLIAYWRHGSWLGAVNCPVCRQRVTIILPMFREEEQGTDENRRITAEMSDYNRRFSGDPRPLMDYIYDLPMLLRHVARDFFSFSGIVWMFRLRILLCFVAALVYFISPLDIIPEAIFGVLGLLDDVFVLLLLAIYVSVIYRGIVAGRNTMA